MVRLGMLPGFAWRLGRSALDAGDLARAREFLEQAMRLAVGQSYQPGRVFAELGLGLTARRRASLTLAETHLRTSCQPGSETDVARTIALSELGLVAEQLGDPAAARSSHLESLAAARQLGGSQTVALALSAWSARTHSTPGPTRAARLLGAAKATRGGVGASPEPGAGESAYTDRIAVAARRALGDAAFGNGRLLTTGQASFLG